MGIKRSPGCKCCGCVADANHVCRCNCPVPFPKEFHTDAGLGPAILTWSPTAAQWLGKAFAPGTQTYYEPTIGAGCTPYSVFDMEVRYALVACSGPSGSLKWRFILSFPVNNCNDLANSCFRTTYGDPAWFQTVYTSLIVEISFTCDFSMLTFNLPGTMFDTGGIACPGGLAVPGGGGTITVVP